MLISKVKGNIEQNQSVFSEILCSISSATLYLPVTTDRTHVPTQKKDGAVPTKTQMTFTSGLKLEAQ